MCVLPARIMHTGSFPCTYVPHIRRHVGHHISKGVEGTQRQLDHEPAHEGKDPPPGPSAPILLHIFHGINTPFHSAAHYL